MEFTNKLVNKLIIDTAISADIVLADQTPTSSPSSHLTKKLPWEFYGEVFGVPPLVVFVVYLIYRLWLRCSRCEGNFILGFKVGGNRNEEQNGEPQGEEMREIGI